MATPWALLLDGAGVVLPLGGVLRVCLRLVLAVLARAVVVEVGALGGVLGVLTGLVGGAHGGVVAVVRAPQTPRPVVSSPRSRVGGQQRADEERESCVH